MTQEFANPHSESRPIVIRITKSHISFHFKRERNREFYWLGVSDWKDPKANFAEHMRRKSWFSHPMEKFINQSLGIRDYEDLSF